VVQNARRYLSVNPLVPLPYRFLAQGSEAQGKLKPAIEAYRAILELNPQNPGEIHYNLARLMWKTGDPGARRQVLQALEEAPRHRAALALLLEMQGESKAGDPAKKEGGG
jgi:tetratricopeptide (TPR) repeat protein